MGKIAGKVQDSRKRCGTLEYRDARATSEWGHSRPNELIDFEFALTSTPDISLRRTKCRKGQSLPSGSAAMGPPVK